MQILVVEILANKLKEVTEPRLTTLTDDFHFESGMILLAHRTWVYFYSKWTRKQRYFKVSNPSHIRSAKKLASRLKFRKLL